MQADPGAVHENLSPVRLSPGSCRIRTIRPASQLTLLADHHLPWITTKPLNMAARDLQKCLHDISQTATNIYVEIPKFYGVNHSEEIVAFATRLLSNGDLHTLFQNLTLIFASLAPSVQREMLQQVRILQAALVHAMFVFPVNDGMLEKLHFVKTSEYGYVREARESLERWSVEFVDLIIRWEDKAVDDVVFGIQSEIGDAVKNARKVKDDAVSIGDGTSDAVEPSHVSGIPSQQ
jgi:hypothetical protein